MFKVNTLPECDVIFTKNVLHDWSNKKYIEVFKNFHNFVKDDGIVVNVSLHLAEPWETQDGWENFSTDMVMLCLFREAKVRTVNEYINSHNKAGFEVVKTVKLGPKGAPQTIIIASKNNCCFHKLGLLWVSTKKVETPYSRLNNIVENNMKKFKLVSLIVLVHLISILCKQYIQILEEIN